jgi:hypothetical protein
VLSDQVRNPFSVMLENPEKIVDNRFVKKLEEEGFYLLST